MYDPDNFQNPWFYSRYTRPEPKIQESLKKHIMKKYRLKKWYPSLPEDWQKEMKVITHTEIGVSGYQPVSLIYCNKILCRAEVENNPEFWEEVEEEKKLLLKSADGYRINTGDEYYFVSEDFALNLLYAQSILILPPERCFAKKGNAEQYIYDHKPVFSRKQVLDEIDEIFCSKERTGLNHIEGSYFDLALIEFMRKLEL